MERMSIYLRSEERELLDRVARETGRSRAEIIRAALRAFTTSPREGGRQFAIAGCVVGDGTSAADVAEEEYLKGFGE